MSTKFFVFGGGRWREVCVQTGSVSGWGRNVQFVHRKGTRLAVVKHRAVLQGLAALAANAPTSVRNGPRLPHCRVLTRAEMKKPPATNTAVKQTQTDGMRCTLKGHSHAACLPESEHKHARSSASLPLTDNFAKLTETRKKLLKTSKEIKYGRSCQPRAGTVECAGPPPPCVPGPLQPDHYSDGRLNNNPKKYANLRQKSSSSGEFLVAVSETNTSKQTRGASTSVKGEARGPARRNQVSSTGGVQKPTNRKRPRCVSTSTDDFQVALPSASSTATRRRAQVPASTRPGGAAKRLAAFITKMTAGPYLSEEMSQMKCRSEALPRASAGNMFMELTVEESDVLALRGFLESNAPEEVILQFDTDESYKQSLFYSINPLVRLERCPRIQELLRRRAHNVRIEDFVSQLGLRSVSTSLSREQARSGTLRSHAMRSKDHADNNKKNLTGTRHVERGPLSMRSRVLEEKSRSTSSDSDNSPLKKVVREAVVQPTLVTPSRRKRSRFQEYSALEDQAIVQWVSEGARGSMVNGNTLWQELDRHYCSLTGQSGIRNEVLKTLPDNLIALLVSIFNAAIANCHYPAARNMATVIGRTWQSLRNRYLRYLLPALAHLGLSPHRASALRAAAATGNFKNKKYPLRRNSIFDTTVVQAASSRAPERRPRLDSKQLSHSGQVPRYSIPVLPSGGPRPHK